jgi:serine/threonine protein kinase
MPLPDEVRILKMLGPHQNILRFFGADYTPVNKYNVFFEYCSGSDLEEQMAHFTRGRRAAPEVFVLHVLVSIASALMYMHAGLVWDEQLKGYYQKADQLPVLHGDMKCENVFLRWSSEPERATLPDVVLGDFGAAQPTLNARSISGTAGYGAPEICSYYDFDVAEPMIAEAASRLVGVMTTATDVYSFGQILMVICSWRLHVTGADPAVTPVRVGEERQGVPLPAWKNRNSIKEVIQGCPQPAPADRPGMSAHAEKGISNTIDELRLARDRHLRERPPLRPEMWVSQGQEVSRSYV